MRRRSKRPTAVAGRTAACQSFGDFSDVTLPKGESARDTPVRTREGVVLEEQEDRLPVVVEPLLEVLEAQLQLVRGALERRGQHLGAVRIDPAVHSGLHCADGRDVEAEDQGLVAPEPGAEGALRGNGDLRVFVAVSCDRPLDQVQIATGLLVAPG